MKKRILNQTGASNTLRPGKYGHRFVHNISKCISPMRLIYFVPGSTWWRHQIETFSAFITMTSQWASLTIVYSIVYSDADQRKHQSSASLGFVRGIHREPVNSPHKGPVTRKMLPFDDVIMLLAICAGNSLVQSPVTRSFDVFFDLCLNGRLSKQWWGWWFEAPSRPLWRHCNEVAFLDIPEWFRFAFL